MSIGSRIKEIREKKRISVADLVKATGIVKQQIYAYEAGKYDPGKENLASIAKALGVTVDEFYRETGVREENFEYKPALKPEVPSWEMWQELKASNAELKDNTAAFKIEIERLWGLVDKLMGQPARTNKAQ